MRGLQDDLGKLQHRMAHQANNHVDQLQQRGGMISAPSTVSLLSTHSGGKSDLENMTREQLIAQCRREKEMKDQVSLPGEVSSIRRRCLRLFKSSPTSGR